VAETGSFTFSDPQKYQATIRPARVEVVVTAKGDFHAELTRVELPRVLIQRSRVNLPMIAHSTVSTERVSIFIPATDEQATIRHSGLEASFGQIIAVSPGSSHHVRTEAPVHWATLSLTREEFVAAGRVLAGRELTVPSVTHRLQPSRQLMSLLLGLHAEARKLAAGSFQVFENPEPKQALEQALVHAMIMCMTDGSPVEMSWGTRKHLTILARFEDFVAANENRPLYLAEICAAIGASDRLLRMCCQEHLGMGPMRYLWLRRMHIARRALGLASPATATVTRIAMDHGFWELGRFAGRYRALFGESPSASLLRPPVDWRTPNDRPLALSISERA
jgi:AraC-like DNA-binding protein